MERRFLSGRKNLRLPDFDYTTLGAYFITVCVQARGIAWFGEVTRDGMQLNAAGEMVLKVWNDLPRFYPGVAIDTFIVMPDHVHGIITLECMPTNDIPSNVGAGPRARPDPTHATETPAKADGIGVPGQPQEAAPTYPPAFSLPDAVQRFKSLTTHRYIRGVRDHGWPPFEKRFWQRVYFEHVVRDDADLATKRGYILSNPARWLETRGQV